MENRTNFDLNYIIKQNIERVRAFMRDPKMFIFYNSDPYYKCEILEGKFLWEEGSKFITLRKSNKIPNKTLNLNFTCLSSENKPYYKFILFAVTIQNVITFKKKVSLFHVSSDNYTVMRYEFYDFSKEDQEYIDIMKELTPNDVSKLDMFLRTSGMDFFQNESIVINLTVDSLWDKIFNFELLKKLYPIHLDSMTHINDNNEIDSKKELKSYLTIGERFKIFYLKENKMIIRIKEVVNKEDEIKKEFVVSLLSSSEFNISEIKFPLISIDNSKSYFSICHFFSTFNDTEQMKHLSQIKVTV